MCDLQTRRTIINPERFLYSRANMNPNPIEEENRFHVLGVLEQETEKIIGNCGKINCSN